MSEEIPQWALKLAVEKCGLVWTEEHAHDLAEMGIEGWGKPIRRFALYIAKHEDDLLLKEAREMAAKYCLEEGCHSAAAKCRSGEWDNGSVVRWRLEGLRRGIELGKAGAA